MAKTASNPAPLTSENLKSLASSTYHHHHPYSAASCTTSSESDAASLFSDSRSVISSTSSAPEDEDAPFTVQEASGETITVYSSLDQAVRYSMLRADQERRAEDESRRFAYAPLPNLSLSSSLSSGASPTELATSLPPTVEAPAGYGEDADDDAYFSMG